MVHGIRLEGGAARWYRNRYVRGDSIADAKGWPRVPGPRHNMGGIGPNTNVIGHAGKTWALVEAGTPPFELTDELESVAFSDFEGTLPGGFTAHPKRDPVTDELHANGDRTLDAVCPQCSHQFEVELEVDGLGGS